LNIISIKIWFCLKIYISETNIRKIDGLCRWPDRKVKVEKDIKNQKLIKEKYIYRLAEVVIEESKVDIMEEWK